MPQRYLITAALPYANGAIHIGHLVEYIQADIFVRALKMAGEDVLFVCGTDSHGTAIEINAQKAGIAPDAFIQKWQKEHEASFAKFGIVFDGGYGTTHTPLNQKHAEAIYGHLQQAGHIATRDVEQLYDPTAKRFLADRQIRGTCPKCKTPDQYGDACEKCGTTYRPTELIEPKSVVSGTTPILRTSKHYFFELQHYAEQLKTWTSNEGVLSPDVQNYLNAWFTDGLKDWDISRDGPYFGFKIPGEDNKYFYVWLDAPIGYISLCEKAAEERGLTLANYWQDPSCHIVHFIGKDIVYFHTLFWPAMLMAANYTLPSTIAVHGMLTVNGEKMSKSRGTFILADALSQQVEPEALRYYYGCKLTPRVEDIDLSFEDFAARVNADLVNKVVNLVSRTVPMLHRFFDGFAGEMDSEAKDMIQEISERTTAIEQAYRARDTAQVARDVVAIAEMANRYLQEQAPWERVKKDPVAAHRQLTTALWVGKVCLALLKPMLPKIAEQTESMLKLAEPFSFSNMLDGLRTDVQLLPYPRLFERVDLAKLTQLTEKPAMPEPSYISIDDFMKVELRAARVVNATAVEGSDKLIACELDVGECGKRNVFSGLRPHVAPEDLIGKTVALVFNLAPRKMRFGVSEGMILACGENPPTPVFLPHANPGDRIG